MVACVRRNERDTESVGGIDGLDRWTNSEVGIQGGRGPLVMQSNSQIHPANKKPATPSSSVSLATA